MSTLGSRLRRARLEKGIEIRQIAEELRISSRYIEAMEAEESGVLPGGIFSRSFYRQYAAALGVSDKWLEADILKALHVPEVPSIPGQEALRAEEEGIARVTSMSSRRPAHTRRPLASVMILVAVVAGCAGLFELWQRARESRENSVAVARKPAPQAPAPAPVVAPAAPARQESAPVAEVKAVAEAPMPTAGLVLHLSATEKTWVSVTVGGKVIFTGVLEPSETKQLSGAEGARLLIGNAGGVEVQWKGKSLGPIGPRGQVRVVVLTQQGAEILSPPKKPSTDSL